MKTILKTLQAHDYHNRTLHNVLNSDATLAIAIRFDTPGEELTRTMCRKANKPYLAVSYHDLLSKEFLELAKKFILEHSVKVLNVAGNSISHFHKRKYTQYGIDTDVALFLDRLDDHTLCKVISGGQTGIDWAAGVASEFLGLKAVMTFPARFRQRNAHGVEVYSNHKMLRKQINEEVRWLKENVKL